MDSQAWLGIAAVAVAVTALIALVALSLTLRRTRADVRALQGAHAHAHAPGDAHAHAPGDQPTRSVPVVTSLSLTEAADKHGESAVVITRDGRTIVLPTSEQVVNATMGRPLVRGAVLSYGLAQALRPESRDRIRGMVRREFRRRRKMRLQAGRRAARGAPVDVPTAQAWLGTTAAGSRAAPTHREDRS